MTFSSTQRPALRLMAAAACFAVLGATAAEAQDGEKYQLRYNLSQGESYDSSVSTEQVISQEMMGQKSVTTQKLDLASGASVAEVAEDGTQDIRYIFERVQGSVEGDAMSMTFDSDNADEEPSGPMAALFTSLVDKPLIVSIEPDGDVAGIEGFGAVIDDVIENAGIPDEQMKARVRSQLQDQFSDDMLKEIILGAVFSYPADAMAVGDSWTSDGSESVAFPVQMTDTYTLESVADGVATIKVSSDIVPLPDRQAQAMGQMLVDVALTGTKTGKLMVDLKSGLVTSGETSMDLSGEINAQMGMPNAQGESETMTIPMSVKSNTTVSNKMVAASEATKTAS
ncbi:MAG: DUF6263 family protein [Sumerlaeia bacterium]